MAKVNARKRGKTWSYYFEAAKIDGKRSRISKGGFPTQKAALEAGTKALAEYNSAGLHFVPSEISFNDYLDYWLNEYCRVNLNAVTVTGYEKKIRLHIKPALGKYKLKALTPSVLQAFINNMFNDGFSRNSLAVVKGILSGSLNYAVEPLRYIESSPMTYIKLPAKRAKAANKTRTAPHVFIPQDRITDIFNRFPEGTSTHISMQLGYKCGLRLGEAFALTWDNIDFSNKKITIKQQMQWSESNKSWYITKPKYESIRIIEIDNSLVELLQREKARQDDAKSEYADFYTYLYLNEQNQINTDGVGEIINLVNVRENGTLIHPRTMQHTSRIIHYELNYPEFDFHSFRHTHATMLAEKDAPPKYVQHRLGHKNIQVTMQIYQHLTENMSNKGAIIIESLF